MRHGKNRGAWMARVGEKGQIVIPKEAREMFDIHPGDTLLLLGDLKRGLAIVNGDKMAEIAGRIFGDTPGEEETDESDSDR